MIIYQPGDYVVHKEYESIEQGRPRDNGKMMVIAVEEPPVVCAFVDTEGTPCIVTLPQNKLKLFQRVERKIVSVDVPDFDRMETDIERAAQSPSHLQTHKALLSAYLSDDLFPDHVGRIQRLLSRVNHLIQHY
jgi:hypothetical protein